MRGNCNSCVLVVDKGIDWMDQQLIDWNIDERRWKEEDTDIVQEEDSGIEHAGPGIDNIGCLMDLCCNDYRKLVLYCIDCHKLDALCLCDIGDRMVDCSDIDCHTLGWLLGWVDIGVHRLDWCNMCLNCMSKVVY